jgi:ankyrin repeat protein
MAESFMGAFRSSRRVKRLDWFGQDYTDIAILLLDYGANVNVQGGFFGNALQAASTVRTNPAAVRLLLEHGANVNAQGGQFGTALQAACSKSAASIVRILLQAGAKVNARGGKFDNALQAACTQREGTEIVQLLLDNGADINMKGGPYETALQAASKTGRTGLVEFLLERGAYDDRGAMMTEADQSSCDSEIGAA